MRFTPVRKILMIALAGATAAIATIYLNSYSLGQLDHQYQFWAQSLTPPSPHYAINLESDLRERVDLYVNLIESDFLVDNMVVNRLITGDAIDICDSLLFSSLYYVALKKLNYHEYAHKIWDAIESSNHKGEWYRHPKCIKPTSRDMIVGLLAALSQNPPHTKNHINNTLNFVRNNRGYLSGGSADVSYLTPGLAEFFRIFAQGYNLDDETTLGIPMSFATLEYSTLIVDPGYRSHLIAMQIWIEMELKNRPQYPNGFDLRATTEIFKEISSILDLEPFESRMSWISQELYQQDPENLFLKYLRIRSAGALNRNTRLLLMSELLAMPQFPKTHTPENCNRDADYLWQRSSDEYYSKDSACTITFNGVDFLWMAGLLLEPEIRQITEVHADQPAALPR